jgi:hypothetical protein
MVAKSHEGLLRESKQLWPTARVGYYLTDLKQIEHETREWNYFIIRQSHVLGSYNQYNGCLDFTKVGEALSSPLLRAKCKSLLHLNDT